MLTLMLYFSSLLSLSRVLVAVLDPSVTRSTPLTPRSPPVTHRYTDFPENGSLTKGEEKILRKIRRKIRNKKSAQCSRQRKKEYVEELEKKYSRCSNENLLLKKEVVKLRRENSSLVMKIKNLVADVGSAADLSDQVSFKTSFFVLCLSFLLILFPFLA